MSDSNKDRQTDAREMMINQPTHYEQSRTHFLQAMHKGTTKYNETLQSSTPHTMREASIHLGQAAWSAKSDLGKSLYHAGMGFMQEVSRQNPNSGQQLNDMIISQHINQGSEQAKHFIQNSNYSSKAKQPIQHESNQPAINKGIEAARQKAADNLTVADTSQSTNKGITSYQSKVSGQSSSISKDNSGGSSKGINQGR